jgi:hypothetical protein
MPTYVDAEVIIDRPPPPPSPRHASHSLRKEGHMHRSSFSHGEKDYGMEKLILGTGRRAPVVLCLCAGEAMLACRTKKKKMIMMKEGGYFQLEL